MTISQNGHFDTTFTLNVLNEFIRPPKGRKHASRSHSLGVSTIRAVETLGGVVPNVIEGSDDTLNSVLILAARAASHQSWGNWNLVATINN